MQLTKKNSRYNATEDEDYLNELFSIIDKL